MNQWHSRETYRTWSRGLNRALRHSQRLHVNPEGFAWLEDIIWELGNATYHLDVVPGFDDILFIVATQDKGRYECSSVDGTGGRFDLLIRCVQGHSGNIAAQMVHNEAFGELNTSEGTPFLYHYTKSEFLHSIPGR